MEIIMTLALMEAVKLGRKELVEIFLEDSADPNVPDNFGQTPLMVAAERGYVKIVFLLLKNNANPNIQDYYGRTALMIAAEKGYANIVKLLLQNAADRAMIDQEGHNAETYALAGAFLYNNDLLEESDCAEETMEEELEQIDPNKQSFDSLSLLKLFLDFIEPENKIRQEYLDAMAAIAAREDQILAHVKLEDNEYHPLIENVTIHSSFVYYDS